MFLHRRFSGLYDELAAIKLAMISRAPTQAKTGHVINALGLIDETATTTNQQFAHLLQGIESKALQAMLGAFESAVLPLHDGVVCTALEDVKMAEQAIKQATEIGLQIGEPEPLKLGLHSL